MKNERDFVPDHFRLSDWVQEGQTPEGEETVVCEFDNWHTGLPDNTLAEKVTRLWRLFRDGKLSRPDKALVIRALLYCITPIDLIPDFIPFAGYLDDLFIVLGVLAYLDKNTE